MSRSCGARASWTAALVLAAGCQNYNFNPVGHCLIQAGREEITVSTMSTADVLFVIDDSGSMAAEQDRLAAAFSAFITHLDAANAARAAADLTPIDFHIAITTTSIFLNFSPYTATDANAWTCKSSCGSAGQVCCKNSDNTPALGPRACTSSSQCTAGNECRTDCNYVPGLTGGSPLYLYGEQYCCPSGTRTAPRTDPIPCSFVSSNPSNPAPCGTFERHYYFAAGCAAGVATNGALYPHGNFVGTPTNPRVLHFDKSLYTSTGPNRQGFTRTELIDFFAGNPVGTNANAKVGTCGTGQEQGLQAARLALEKALAGRQTDTYSISGVATPSTAEWPHGNSKLVLVFVGDEDDCSSPEDPSGGVVYIPGINECGADAWARRYDVASQVVDYFTGLGRPLGAAFVVSTAQTICGRPNPTITTCTPGLCCQQDCPAAPQCTSSGSPTYCGGQEAGTRFFAAASAFRAAGADVVMGSVCDPNFDLLLNEIADMVVKLPTGLLLPSLPAEEDVTTLRIADSSGQTVKLCGVAAPSNLTAVEAAAAYQWWFTQAQVTDPTDPAQVHPYTASQYVYINPAGGCVASPGETYSAEYIGRLPAAGCHTDADCQTALGGAANSWTCYAGMDTADPSKCASTAAPSVGTCLCGGPSKNCPNGKVP